MKLFLIVTAILTAPASAFAFAKGKLVFGLVLGIVAGIAGFKGGLDYMKKGVSIKQNDIVADENKGGQVDGVPSEGTQLPPIDIEQSKITARKNTGLEISYNPGSGPVEMNDTSVKKEGMSVRINKTFGDVTVDPSVGSVKFINEE